jgi:hypothetical protein
MSLVGVAAAAAVEEVGAIFDLDLDLDFDFGV